MHSKGTGDTLEFSEVDQQEALCMDKKPCCKDWASFDPNPHPPSSGRRDIRGSRSGRHTSFSSMRGGRMTLALSALRCGLVTRSTSEKRNRYTSNCRRKKQGQSIPLGSGESWDGGGAGLGSWLTG